MVGDDPDGSGPAEAALTMPVELIEQHDALAGVNANAFSRVRREDRLRPWEEGMPVDIVGIALSDGILHSPLDNPKHSNSRVAFWLNSESTPRISRPAKSAEVAQAVGDFCAVLLRGGNVVPEEGGPRHPRTALGFDEAKRFLLLVVVDGRRKGYSDGMTMHELAALMQGHGCRDAINMDGGGSSVMLYRDDKSSEIKTANRPSGNAHRPIPVMIGVRPAKRP